MDAKEAYMKATGQGLYLPLEKFAVLPASPGSALRLRLIEQPAGGGAPGPRDLQPGPGLSGAGGAGSSAEVDLLGIPVALPDPTPVRWLE